MARVEAGTGFLVAAREAAESNECDALPVPSLDGQGWPGTPLAGELAGQEQAEAEPKLTYAHLREQDTEVHSPCCPAQPLNMLSSAGRELKDVSGAAQGSRAAWH